MKLSPRYNDGDIPQVRISYLTRDSMPENNPKNHSTMTWDSKVNTRLIDEEFRQVVNENSLKDSWGSFIAEMVERLEGDLYFYTLTFGWESEPLIKAVENAVDRFVKFARDNAVGGIVVIEKGTKYGRLHAHGILSGFGIRTCQDFWESQFGYTKVEKVRDKSQVGAYIAKYCAKQIGTSAFRVISKDRAKERSKSWVRRHGSISGVRSRMS